MKISRPRFRQSDCGGVWCGLPIWLAAAILAVPCLAADAVKPLAVADIKHTGPVDFEKEILPILRSNCLACHNVSAAESELVMETPRMMQKGGVSGPAVVPGKADESLVFKLAAHSEEPLMPPADNDRNAHNLSPEQLGLLRLWINEGATGEVLGSGPIAWQPLPAGFHPIYAVAVAPDGSHAAAACANQIFIYDVASRREVGRLKDPNLLAAGQADGGSPSQSDLAHIDAVQSLAFSPDGERLASGAFRTVNIWRRPHNERIVDLAAADADVTSLAVSPNGAVAAIGETSGRIHLNDVATGKRLRTLQGHGGSVSALTFNAGGDRLLSGSIDRTVRMWDVADGREIGTLSTPAPVTALALLLEGAQIAVATDDNLIRTWPLPGPLPAVSADAAAQPVSPPPIKQFNGHSAPITSMVPFDAKGTRLFSGSHDGTARIWDAAGGNEVANYNDGGPITAVAVRPDGKRAATASEFGRVKLWNTENGQLVAQIAAERSVTGSIDRLRVAVDLAKRRSLNAKADLAQVIKDRDAEREAVYAAVLEVAKTDVEAKKKTAAVTQPQADHQKAQAALATLKADLATAEDVKKKLVEAAAATAAATAAAAAAPAPPAAVPATEEEKKKADEEAKKAEEAKKKADEAKKKADDEALKTADAAAGGMQARMETAMHQRVRASLAMAEQRRPIRSVAFSPDGLQAAMAGDDGVIRVFASETGQVLDPITGQKGGVIATTFVGTGRLLSMAADKSLVVWNTLAPWVLERRLGTVDSTQAFVDRVSALDFSPDGRLLATGGGTASRSGELKLWDVETGILVRAIAEPHSDAVLCLQFSPDGKQVASGAADRFMKVFDVETGTFVKSFEGHGQHVLGVSWRADGRVLATGGADKAIKIWDFRAGEVIRSLPVLTKEVTAVRYVGASDNFLAAAGDKTVSTRNSDGGSGQAYAGSTDYVYAVGASTMGTVVVAGGEDGVVRIWNQQGQPITTFTPRPPQPVPGRPGNPGDPGS